MNIVNHSNNVANFVYFLLGFRLSCRKKKIEPDISFSRLTLLSRKVRFRKGLRCCHKQRILQMTESPLVAGSVHFKTTVTVTAFMKPVFRMDTIRRYTVSEHLHFPLFALLHAQLMLAWLQDARGRWHPTFGLTLCKKYIYTYIYIQKCTYFPKCRGAINLSMHT